MTPDVYSFSVTPAIQTKVNEQICIAFTLNCPTNTYYQRFLGYTIDWGDGKGAIPYEYAKTLTDYIQCSSSGSGVCFSDPGTQDYIKAQTPQRSLTKCQTMPTISAKNITFTPWRISIGEGSPAMSAWEKNFSILSNVYVPPLGYCGIPKGFGAFGSEVLSMNDRSTCSKNILGSNSCAVGSNGKAMIGVTTKVDELHAPNVVMRNYAEVFDGVWANSITAQFGATYVQKSQMDKLKRVESFNPTPNTIQSQQFVESGKTLVLKPGTHASITVRANGTLKLDGAGFYFFNNLFFESGSTLYIIQGSDITELYTHGFTFRGKVINATASRFLVGILGSSDSYIDPGFVGSVWAPHGTLVLGQSNSQSFQGSYFAKILSVHQGSKIEYVPFIRNKECQ